jgi:hypothetical protein
MSLLGLELNDLKFLTFILGSHCVNLILNVQLYGILHLTFLVLENLVLHRLVFSHELTLGHKTHNIICERLAIHRSVFRFLFNLLCLLSFIFRSWLSKIWLILPCELFSISVLVFPVLATVTCHSSSLKVVYIYKRDIQSSLHRLEFVRSLPGLFIFYWSVFKLSNLFVDGF